MSKKSDSFLRWLPRILSILFIIFLSMFSMDVFGEHLGFWGTVLGLFMHNIPVFAIIIILIVAWRRPLVGAIAFWFLAVLYIIWAIVARGQGMWAFNPVSLGAIIIGVLFWVSWKRIRKLPNDHISQRPQ